MEQLKNFKFNKSYGQNFILDTNFLNSVVKLSDVNNSDNILEIGTGAGTLTKELAKVCKKIVSYEIDNNLTPIIEDNLKSFNNVNIVFKDILSVEDEEINNNFRGESFIVFANLPYYITTPIIFKFIENPNAAKLIIMVQSEVANRLCAKPGTKDYGALTVSVNFRADVKIIKRVSRNMFIPAPNVDSCIVEITKQNKYKIENYQTLAKLIKSAFHMRRKTLINNLKTDFNKTGEELNQILTDCNISPAARGETLTCGQFVNLANML